MYCYHAISAWHYILLRPLIGKQLKCNLKATEGACSQQPRRTGSQVTGEKHNSQLMSKQGVPSTKFTILCLKLIK